MEWTTLGSVALSVLEYPHSHRQDGETLPDLPAEYKPPLLSEPKNPASPVLKAEEHAYEMQSPQLRHPATMVAISSEPEKLEDSDAQTDGICLP